MEDKRTALAILLIIVVVMVYSEIVLAPYTRAPVQSRTTPASVTPGATAPAQNAPKADLPTGVSAEAPSAVDRHVTAAEIQAAPTLTIDTGAAAIKLVMLGGRISSLTLTEYRDRLEDARPLDLVSSLDGAPLPLGLTDGTYSDEFVTYQLGSLSGGMRSGDTVTVNPGGELTVSLQGRLPTGPEFTKVLHFRADSYLFDVTASLSGGVAGAPLWLQWTSYLSELAKADSLNIHRFAVLADNNKVQAFMAGDVTEGMQDPINAAWACFDDKYFSALLIPSSPTQAIKVGRKGSLYITMARLGQGEGRAKVYAGPKEYETLRTYGLQLERVVDLGFFSFLAYPLLRLMLFFYSFLGNYGLAIVLLTLTIKAAFYPLTKASLTSMKAMQELQPEIQALRERIKDPTQLNQEMLGLYKKRGVNPVGGCFPVLIQIPVFFGLYSALQHAIELRHAPFALWVNDLSAPEHLNMLGVRVPLMIIIMGVTMFIQQYTTPTPTMDPTQRKMMLSMSVFFTLGFIIYPFPAGLALYMLVNTTISLVQQRYLKGEFAAPFRATILASVAIFFVAYVLTKL